MKKNFWYLVGLTFIFWYVVIAFFRWEYDWVKHLEYTTTLNRVWFLLAVVVKFAIDGLIWRLIKDDNRPEDKQKTYIYED